jgi:hypothetical protein
MLARPICAVASTLLLNVALLGSPQAFSQENPNYTPPSTPPLHQPSDLDYQSKYSAPFVGLGLQFGQTMPAGDGKPGLEYAGRFEVGYAAGFQSFSKMETSLEAFYGASSFRLGGDAGGQASLNGMMGLMAKIGYGHSVQKDLFSLWKLGIGGAFADFEVKNEGTTYRSTDTVSGVLFQLGWALSKRMSETTEITGGFDWTHSQFSLGDVKGGGAVVDLNRNAVLNNLGIQVGWRLIL